MFAPQLVFQLLDSSFLGAFPVALIAAKGGCPVLEKTASATRKILSAEVDIRHTNPILVHGRQDGACENQNFFFGGVIVTLFSHGLPSVRDGLSQTTGKSNSR
jgi:hypothetical protein